MILYVLELDLLLRDLNCLPLCCGMWTSETNGYFVRCRTWVGLGDIGCRKQKNPFFDEALRILFPCVQSGFQLRRNTTPAAGQCSVRSRPPPQISCPLARTLVSWSSTRAVLLLLLFYKYKDVGLVAWISRWHAATDSAPFSRGRFRAARVLPRGDGGRHGRGPRRDQA